MAVEKGPDDAPVQRARIRLMMRLRLPFGDDLIAAHEAKDMQPFGVRRPATKASTLRGICFLKALFAHD